MRLRTLTHQVLIFALLIPSWPFATTVSAQSQEIVEGLQFRLSEGRKISEPKPVAPPAEALSKAETEALLNRIQPIKTVEKEDFVFKEKSPAPPLTGQTISEKFPTEIKIENAVSINNDGPLTIIRCSPEGDVEVARSLSVTFSQPMIPVSSQTEAAKVVPIKLSPQISGKWHWIGTRTLIFEPQNRFPMATEFTVEIPSGTKSTTGNFLLETKKFSFRTPPPQIKKSLPSGDSVSLNPLFFIAFDQRINAAEALKTVHLTDGKKEFHLRLATARDGAINEALRELAEDQCLIFQPQSELPAGTKFRVTIGPHTPSAEGPLTTTRSQSYSFGTHQNLVVTQKNCGHSPYTSICNPVDNWEFEFNNTLDEKNFDPKSIQISPPLKDFEATIYGNSIVIGGSPKALTIYTVTLPTAIKDIFGQSLSGHRQFIFGIGKNLPGISGPTNGLHTLDPFGPREISFYTVNHQSLKIAIYRALPEQYPQFVEYQKLRDRGIDATPPGRLIFSRRVIINSKPEEIIESRINLNPALQNGLGHVVLIVAPDKKQKDFADETRLWLQSTLMGIDSFCDATDLLGWVTSLRDGKPIVGARLSIFGSEAHIPIAVTNTRGLTKISLPGNFEEPKILLARTENDSAILAEEPRHYFHSNYSSKNSVAEEIRWHLFDDRGMYRPEEEIHLKGWLRKLGKDKNGDVEALTGSIKKIKFVAKDSRGLDLERGEAKVNQFGGFDLKFQITQPVSLGRATITLTAIDDQNNSEISRTIHSFQIQEFRRPEYEVTTSVSPAPHFIGNQATVTVNANYFAGGGLPDAEVNWSVTATATNYTPPNQQDFSFGKWEPWWERTYHPQSQNYQNYKARTGVDGKHHLQIDFDAASEARPYSLRVQANVEDVSRQNWSATSTLLVHPAELYVGLRADRFFAQPGQALTGMAIVTDLEGNAMAGREIKMRAVLLEGKYRHGAWEVEEKEPQEFTIISDSKPVPYNFMPKNKGSYRLTATIIDQKNRRNESSLPMWVAGGSPLISPDEIEKEKVVLIPDREEYRAGDIAEFLVQAPFFPAEGIFTLQRNGILETHNFSMPSNSTTIKVPIKENWTPNIFLQVDLVGIKLRANKNGAVDNSVPGRPAFASGSLDLKIPPLARKLKVIATPRQNSLEPGSETIIDIEVKNAENQPLANCETSLVVVDEAILALSDYRMPDPLATFYPHRWQSSESLHQRENIWLASRQELKRAQNFTALGLPPQMVLSPGVAAPPPMPTPLPGGKIVTLHSAGFFGGSLKFGGVPGGIGGGKGDGGNGGIAPIKSRADFNPLAAFVESIITDASGKAAIKVHLPDNLTRYRVMAVATDGAQKFGIGESAITARLPLMIRPSAPRFLNYGDRFELPVVLQNQTDEPMRVEVAVRGSNINFSDKISGWDQTSSLGKRIAIPPNDRVEVRFPALTINPGKAYFQIVATTVQNDKSYGDAAEISVPVWTPATAESFATYGTLDDGAIVQPIKAPENVFRQFGGLEISTSSTQVQSLTDALIYLTNYPYECSEQISSRILAIAALRDVLAAFDSSALPAPEKLNETVLRDLQKLEAIQNSDGGFGFWRRGEESWPILSIHVAHALQRAKEKDFKVPQAMVERSKSYLAQIEKMIPSTYSPESRRSLIAYALYVQSRLTPKNSENFAIQARRQLSQARLNEFPLEALGWLLMVLSKDKNSSNEVAAIRAYLNNRIEETASTAQFTTAYKDGAHLLLASNRRTDAVLLEAMIADQPNSELIPKLLRGLLAHRKQGRWVSTQENAFVLLALDRYFRTYENLAPNFVARVWLGNDFAGEQNFHGRSTARHQLEIPMKFLDGQNNLTLQKSGSGRLYYRIGMQTAPTELNQKSADYGFTVERTYESIDEPNDVRRDSEGKWHIKAGANIRVRLTMTASARRYHVAVVDPLPAGFEAINPGLAISGNLPKDKNKKPRPRWERPWFEHQNLRDDRVEAFTSLLWEGVYNYSYVVRSTTPGFFIAPPAKAEEMYQPETFGRSASDQIVIEDR